MDSKLIAKGGTADIYDIGGGRILKSFHENKQDYCIENEVECTCSDVAISLGAPKIYERVHDERGRGFVMEYIPGKSMLDVLLESGADCDTEESAVNLAELRYGMNRIDGSMFPKGHDVMRERISRSNYIDQDTKEKLYHLLDSLPQGSCVCHTDLHPGNVIITENGLRVIDWCDTMCDSPWFDVARTLLIFESRTEVPGFDLDMINKLRYKWKVKFRDAYEKLAGKSDRELEGWMAIWAAVRLEEENPVNYPWMKSLIVKAAAGTEKNIFGGYYD